MKEKKTIQRSFMLVILVVITCCFFGCRNNVDDEIEKIPINPKAKNNQTGITIKSVIQLETSDTTLIGHINTIKYYKSRFYIFDQNISKALFVFDSKGKFINKTSLGKGPGEVIEPWNFCIDESNNTILLWDQMTFNLNVYDLNLSFIKSINCPRIAIRSLSALSSSSFLIFSQMFPKVNGEIVEKVEYDYFVYSDDFKTLTKKIHPTDHRTVGVTIDNPICKANGNFFFIAPMDNTIYELANDYESKTFYRFDLGKYQVTEDDLNKGTAYYRSEMKKGNRICSLSNLFINDDYVSVSYSFKDKIEFCIFNRDSRNVINSGDPTLKEQLPPCEIKGLFEDNTFIGITNAMDYNRFVKNAEDTNLHLKSIDDFSNEVILMFSVVPN